MANAIIEKIGVAEAGSKVQQEIERRVEETRDRVDALRVEMDRRKSVAVGSVKDEAATRALTASEVALATASGLLGRIHSASPLKIDAVKARTRRLASCARHMARRREAIASPPIEGYDELNVKKVNAALEGLSFYDLKKVAAYEEANKNRVTVLREIERLTA